MAGVIKAPVEWALYVGRCAGCVSRLLSYFIFSKNIPMWLGSSYVGEGGWGREMHQQVQHNESSTLHTLTPSGELIKGLVKAVKVALNEK